MRRSNRSAEPSRAATRRLAGDEGGSAALEFIAVGVLMLVPLAYLVIALGTVQSQTLGIEAAARFAARTVATGEDPARAAKTVAAQYGIDPASLDVTVACTPVPDPCPVAGSTIVLTVRTDVPLPFLPTAFGLDRIASVPIEANAAQKVSRFGGEG